VEREIEPLSHSSHPNDYFFLTILIKNRILSIKKCHSSRIQLQPEIVGCIYEETNNIKLIEHIDVSGLLA
jgi:hypothetical protein